VTVTDMPFSARLSIAHGLLAGAPWEAPDEIRAAVKNARDVVFLVGHAARTTTPERGWRSWCDFAATRAAETHIVAGLLGAEGQRCPHLRRGSPPLVDDHADYAGMG
jgi:hypothetical protein